MLIYQQFFQLCFQLGHHSFVNDWFLRYYDPSQSLWVLSAVTNSGPAPIWLLWKVTWPPRLHLFFIIIFFFVHVTFFPLYFIIFLLLCLICATDRCCCCCFNRRGWMRRRQRRRQRRRRRRRMGGISIRIDFDTVPGGKMRDK